MRRNAVASLAHKLGLPPSIVEKMWGELKNGSFSQATGIDVTVGEYKGKGIVKNTVGTVHNLTEVIEAIDHEWKEVGQSTAEFRRQLSGKSALPKTSTPHLRWFG